MVRELPCSLRGGWAACKAGAAMHHAPVTEQLQRALNRAACLCVRQHTPCSQALACPRCASPGVGVPRSTQAKGYMGTVDVFRLDFDLTPTQPTECACLQEDASWQVALRALYAVEAVVAHGATAACGEVAVHFQARPRSIFF